MPHESFSAYSIQDLAQACADQTSRRHTPQREVDPCYELFRRAFASPPDQEAWEAILEQYNRLIWLWLGQHASDDACQEVFLRFWRAQINAEEPFVARFPNTTAIMGYIKRCAGTVRIQAIREKNKQKKLLECLQDGAQVELILTRTRQIKSEQWKDDFKALILSKIKDESERLVFELSYHYAMPPREICEEYPQLFTTTRDVYGVKDNLIRRLRRDEDLKEWWIDGGK